MSDQAQPPAKPGPPAAGNSSGPGLVEVIHVIADRVDVVLKLVTTIYENKLKAREAEARYKVRMANGVLVLISLVILVAGGLTYAGKMEGSTFSFLLGSIVGYVLTFIRDSIKPPAET